MWRIALTTVHEHCCHDYMKQTAIALPPAARPGGEFFAAPDTADQRRYEALRAYCWKV